MVQIGAFVLIATLISGYSCQKVVQHRLNFFDISLLSHAVETQPGNVMLSPASIKSVLTMLLEGANGGTETEIRNALRLTPNKEDARELMGVYIKVLQANSSKTFLESANGIFVSEKHQLKREYELMLQQVYSAEVLKTDFQNAVKATDEINGWVFKKTRGLIADILDPLHIKPSTDILLANALYFKSSWQHSFDPWDTRSGCFYRQGQCTNVAMMELDAELKYAYVEDLTAHALELPYEGNKYSMILLVPRERDGWRTLVRDLPFMSLHHVLPLLEPTDVQLTLPRFKVDYSVDMVPILKKMKIEQLFSTSANLSGIFKDHSPQVNSIHHKVYLSVDEQGTEAAASTAVLVNPLMGSLGVRLKVDRPFVFFIVDSKSGVVLFEGKIEEPSAYEEKSAGGNTQNLDVRKVPIGRY